MPVVLQTIAVHTCSHHTAMTDMSFHVTLDGSVIFCAPRRTCQGKFAGQWVAG